MVGLDHQLGLSNLELSATVRRSFFGVEVRAHLEILIREPANISRSARLLTAITGTCLAPLLLFQRPKRVRTILEDPIRRTLEHV